MRHRSPVIALAAIVIAVLHVVGCAGAPVDSLPPVIVDNDPALLAWNLRNAEPIALAAQALSTCPSGQTFYTATATGDAQVSEAAPTTTYATNPAAGWGGVSPSAKRLYTAWSFVGIPSGATINAADLSMTLLGTAPAGTLNLQSVPSTWAESSITWNTRPAVGAVIASAATSGVSGTVVTFTVPPASIAALMAGPSYGLAVDEQSGIAGGGGTRENTTTANRPKLTLCYTPPASPCSNGIKDGAETAVDCGGGTCPACATGLACIVATDCVSNACGASSTCVALSTCSISTVTLPTPIDAQYGATATESLSLYLPTGTPPVGGWPLVVDVHGGGFTSTGGGRNSSALTFHAQILNAQSIALVTVDYVLTAASGVNPFPAAVNDLRQVACWISANGATYGINPARAGWLGYSAGGGLVGVFATTLSATTLPGGTTLATPSCSLTGAVKAWGAEYGNVGMVPSEWSASNPNEWYYANSTPVGGTLPAGFLTDATVTCHSGDPAVYLNDGSADTTVAPAAIRRLAAQCRSVGVATFDLIVPSGLHGYGPAQWGPAIYQPATCQLLGMAGAL